MQISAAGFVSGEAEACLLRGIKHEKTAARAHWHGESPSRRETDFACGIFSSKRLRKSRIAQRSHNTQQAYTALRRQSSHFQGKIALRLLPSPERGAGPRCRCKGKKPLLLPAKRASGERSTAGRLRRCSPKRNVCFQLHPEFACREGPKAGNCASSKKLLQSFTFSSLFACKKCVLLQQNKAVACGACFLAAPTLPAIIRERSLIL